jgi:nucleoside-diphosphate-sugar epimerase
MGAKDILPGPLEGIGRAVAGAVDRSPIAVPVVVPDIEVQLVHEDDVAQAFLLCTVATGPPGTYNIAADDVLTGADVARELGLRPLPIPGAVVHAVTRRLAGLPVPPGVPPVLEWVEAFSHPVIIDSSKAKRDLGWRPRFSGRDALRETFGRDAPPAGP